MSPLELCLASTWKGKDSADLRVEITGPTDRKMVINALNSGAKTFMADLEGESIFTESRVG